MTGKVLFKSVAAFSLAALLWSCEEKRPTWQEELEKLKEQQEENGNTEPGTNPGAPMEATIGQPLPKWGEGYLDIHSINAGRGESTMFIFPDGTTLLIDAGGAHPAETYDYGKDASQGTPSKPDQYVPSSTVISNYVKYYLPDVADGKLDYAMVSHYHSDHYGVSTTAFPLHSSGKFRVNGIPGVCSYVPVSTMIDRGDPKDPPSSDFMGSISANYTNYENFCKWAAGDHGMVREKIRVGANDQIVMLHKPSISSNFEVRNIAGGGYVWTGTGTASATLLPSTAELIAKGSGYDGQVGENVMSLALHITLGRFDYFTAGDIQYNGRSTYPYKDIEAPIAKVMGEVDGMKACHHCTNNTNSPEMLAVLKPDFLLVSNWRDVQPRPETVKRFQKVNPNVRIYSTNMAEVNKATLIDGGVALSAFTSMNGHVVVRVYPDGNRYKIFVLDDEDQKYKVKGIYGPFYSK